MSRFGNANVQSINALIKEKIPRNTTYSHKYIWGIFMEFCCEREYELNEHRSLEELALILKDWAVNMRKKDGTEFKEATVKTMLSVTCPFNSIVFKPARDARDAIRKKLQADPCKRKSSSVSLNLSEVNKIILLWDENTPEGLMRKFYHIAAVELAWRGGEAVACLVDFFKSRKITMTLQQIALNTIRCSVKRAKVVLKAVQVVNGWFRIVKDKAALYVFFIN